MIEFRNKYEENEKLFSTGDEDLDDLLQEVYYSGIEDGYDYAQREFGISNRRAKKAQLMEAKAKIDVINGAETTNELRHAARSQGRKAAKAQAMKTKAGRKIWNNPEVLSDSSLDHFMKQNRKVNSAYKKKARQLILRGK